jgi:hypothetical protein
VTASDVERLYALLHDIDNRLRRIEQAEAKRVGADMGKGSIGRIIMGVAAVSAAIGSIVGVLAAVL